MKEYIRNEINGKNFNTYNYFDKNSKCILNTEENFDYLGFKKGWLSSELDVNLLDYGSKLKYYSFEKYSILETYTVCFTFTKYIKNQFHKLGKLSLVSTVNIEDKCDIYDMDGRYKTFQKITINEPKVGKKSIKLDFYKDGDKVKLDADDELVEDYEIVYAEQKDTLRALEENNYQFDIEKMLKAQYKHRKDINTRNFKKLSYAVIGRYYVDKLINEEQVFDRAFKEIEIFENIILNTENIEEPNEKLIKNCQSKRKLELNIKR